MSEEIKQALAIIERRKALSGDGKTETPHTTEIDRLILEHEDRLNQIEARLRNVPHY